MKQKVKKVTKTMMALIITFSILLVSLIGLTVAYFTDNKSYTGTLEFGNVKLKVTDGNDVEMTDGGKIPFTFGRENTSQKLMPGDTVTINFKVSLQDNSEPAYYLVSLTDTKGVFASNTYFSDGTNSYRVDTENDKVYKIAIDGTETIEATKKVGELNTSEDKHEFTIKAEIDPAYETQGGKTEVSLNIFAIQQANLAKYDADNQDKSAYHILKSKIDLAVNGVDLPEGYLLQMIVDEDVWTSLTSNGFYYTKDVPADYNLDTDLTNNLNNEWDIANINVYKKSDTEIAFASDYKMNAPEDCSSMFDGCSSLTSLDLSNFDTSNVINMSSMFYGCPFLTSLDVSNFDTSKVTVMSKMFYDCSKLTSLDVSNFDTSNVTDMSDMFSGCQFLTSLDVSNFVTSNVTNMWSMFSGCSKLTSLDVSNFITSKVTNMSWMFGNCFKLTSLDVSNFITSKVTNMSWMFGNCFKLTSLDVSNFDTSKVTAFSDMFNNTFSNSPSTSTLTIGDKFVIDGINTFDKATLNTKTKFNTTVKLMRNGVEVTA